MATKNMLILAVFALSFILITACGGGGQPGQTDEIDGDTTEAVSEDGDNDGNESEVEVDGDTTEAADTVEADTVESGDTAENTEDNVPSWTDPVTGLRWATHDSEGGINFEKSVQYCQTLGSSWRIPTIGELRSLVRGCGATSTAGSCTVNNQCLSKESCWSTSCNGCPDKANNTFYWPPEMIYAGNYNLFYRSSSPVTDYSGFDWGLSFNTAQLTINTHDDFLAVRCVTGP